MTSNIGFIAIGRNEGDRLSRCLAALAKSSSQIVYVDSNSTDDSVARANAIGVQVELLTEGAFTAARARNQGFEALQRHFPNVEKVMFIDGDCELIDGFVDAAAVTLDRDPEIGIVTGRCRERRPDASVYNLVCDIEWNGPIGDIDACGGIFMTRVSTFHDVAGFNPQIIAAEDDDYCIRVRQTGARVERIDQDMCWHDADMTRFGQWWRRSVRAGHAYMQVGDLHPGHFDAARKRAWLWGFFIPAAILIAGPFTQWWSLALILLYPASFARTALRFAQETENPRAAAIHAAFLTLAKFANLYGMIAYRWKKQFGSISIIEYKTAATGETTPSGDRKTVS